MKNFKINSQSYEQLTYLEHAPSSKNIKNSLLEEIIETLGDTYYNLSEGIKATIDEMCFLSKEKGFAYASPNYYMDKHNISKTAIYDLVKRLRDCGLVMKVNKSSRKHNGLGKWVICFTSHPNFNKICSILKVEWKPERKTERKAEITETPCESKVQAIETDNTYLVPEDKPSLKNNVIHINVVQDDKKQNVVKFFKYVPKEINDMYAGVFGEKLVDIWRKINQAIKTVGFKFSKEEKLDFGRVIIRNLFLCLKKKNMSIDEMCAYVYSATRNHVYNTLANGFIEDMKIEEVYEEKMYYYGSVESNSGYCPTQYFFKASTPLNPLLSINWLEEDWEEKIG